MNLYKLIYEYRFLCNDVKHFIIFNKEIRLDNFNINTMSTKSKEKKMTPEGEGGDGQRSARIREILETRPHHLLRFGSLYLLLLFLAAILLLVISGIAPDLLP